MKLSNLKAVRQWKALTQQDLAARSGVNRVTIARLESGADEDPFPKTVRKLADALGVAPEELNAAVDGLRSVEPPY